jgi:hypothetical protein
MKIQPILLLAGIFASSISNAQTEIKEDFKPSSLNQPGQEFPKVNSQGYVRFKIWRRSLYQLAPLLFK